MPSRSFSPKREKAGIVGAENDSSYDSEAADDVADDLDNTRADFLLKA